MFRNPYSKMMLVTKAQAAKLPKLYATDGHAGAAVAHVKLFDPVSSYTWFVTEPDPETGDAFGLVVNGGTAEMGRFSLTELLIANHLGASALDPTGRDPEDCGVDR